MSAIQEIPWVIEEQTQVKHQLLQRYIELWMKILWQYQEKVGFPPNLVYIDGFSGPGVYWKDDKRQELVPGSPIIVGSLANELIDKNPKRKLVIIAIDEHNKCVERLQNELNSINRNQQNWIAYNSKFEEAIEEYLLKYNQQAPTFCFVDPFGYSEFSMEILAKLLKQPRTELFINFMVYDINRFFEQPHAKESLNKLYGTDAYLKASHISNPDEKCEYLVDLYKKQLNVIAGAKHTIHFRVNTPGQGTRPKYFLVHASNNIKALMEMKNAMSKTSKQHFSFEAIGISEYIQYGLFEPDDIQIIGGSILSNFKNHTGTAVNFENILEWAYGNTSGIKCDIQKALLDLEKEGLVVIHRSEKQRKNTVTEGARITFNHER